MSRRGPFGRLLAALASARLAAALMAALIALSLLGVLIPQASYLSAEEMTRFRESAPGLVAVLEAVGLTRIFSSWIIVAVAAALAANLTACTLRRLSRRLRSRFSDDAVADVAGEEASAIASLLAGEGWHVSSASPSVLRASKGRSGFWGSTALHAGILVVIVGGGLSALTSFRGTMAISEGQTVTDGRAAYLSAGRAPLLGDAFNGARLRLDSMAVGYTDGERTSVTARMTAETADGRVLTKDVGVNRPFEVDGTAYLLSRSGYAPSIVIGEGGRAKRRVVRLAQETEEGWTDSIRLPSVRSGGGPAVLEMLATPVPLGPGEPLPPEKLDIADPRLAVRLRDGLGVLVQGRLSPGETARLAEGLSLTFEDLVLWNEYLVRREPARWIVYLGFWLCVAGTAWRLVIPERRLTVRLRPGDSPEVTVRSWPLPTRPGADNAALEAGVRAAVSSSIEEASAL